MMKMMPKFKEIMKNMKDVGVTLDVVETVLNLLNNFVENYETSLKSKANHMPSVFIFLLVSSYVNSSEEFTRAMIKNIQRFWDITAGLPRAALFSKVGPPQKIL